MDDVEEVKIYRPITALTFFVYKLLAKILADHISDTLHVEQPKDKAGLLKGCSRMDHMHAITLVVEKCAEVKTFCMTFIRNEEAFERHV